MRADEILAMMADNKATLEAQATRDAAVRAAEKPGTKFFFARLRTGTLADAGSRALVARVQVPVGKVYGTAERWVVRSAGAATGNGILLGVLTTAEAKDQLESERDPAGKLLPAVVR